MSHWGNLHGVMTPAMVGVMTPTLRHTLDAAMRCLGRKADGSLCCTFARTTVEVAGSEHVACRAHAAQVAATMAEVAARRDAESNL